MIRFTTTSNKALFGCEGCGKEVEKNAGRIIYEPYPPNICDKCDLIYKQRLQFERKTAQILNGECTFLDEYQGSGVKIRARHNKCGCVKLRNPDNLLYNLKNRSTRFCSECRPDRPKNTEEFAKELFEKSYGRLLLESEYINAKTKVKVRCNQCQKPDFYVADNIARRLRCKFCDSKRGQYRRKEYSYYYDLFCKTCDAKEYIIDDSEIPKEGIVSAESMVFITHNICGVGRDVVLYDMNNYFCYECKKRERIQKEYEKFLEEFEVASRGEYKLFDDVKYENNKTQMHMFHLKCKNDFYCSRNHFISGEVRCPLCNKSKGERMIREILEERGYVLAKSQYHPLFVSEDGSKYELDIQIIDETGNLVAVIEYDGEQHVNPEKCFGITKEKWEKIVIRDNERNRRSKEHKIPFLRIPYISDTRMAIESVLYDFLERYKVPDYIYEYYAQFDFSTYRK